MTNGENQIFVLINGSLTLRKYLLSFERATGMHLQLLPPDNAKLADSHPDVFCALVHQSKIACADCLRFKNSIIERAQRKYRPQRAACISGLMNVAVPVIVSAKHVATLYGGQVFTAPPSRSRFRVFLNSLGNSINPEQREQLQAAYFRAPVVTPAQFSAMVSMLDIFTGQLAHEAEQFRPTSAAMEHPIIAAARKFVQERIGQSLRSREAANHVHVSLFHFCKLFRQKTGMTFTEYVSRARLERAKVLLANPYTRISEAAFAAGFSSIPHFNRVFRKYTGCSPTYFRDHGSPACLAEQNLQRK